MRRSKRRSGRGRSTNKRTKRRPARRTETKQPARWSPIQWWSKTSSVIGLALGIVGLPTGIWFVTSARPTIEPPAVDHEAPLDRAFVISNDHIWYTLRDVRPRCDFRWMKSDKGFELKGLRMSDMRDTGDMEPGSTRGARCAPVLVPPGRITEIGVDFVVEYKIRWLPWFPTLHSARRTMLYSSSTSRGFWEDRPLRPGEDDFNAAIWLQYAPTTPSPKTR